MKKFILVFTLSIFMLNSVGPQRLYAGEIIVAPVPAPGEMVHLSAAYAPAQLQGIIIHPDNPLAFDFLINRGDGRLDDQQKKQEYTKLVKYFLASLTVPEKNQWVNLSPYEKNRITADDFGKTEMGRDLLGQDYLLKQITSSLMYPDSGLGRDFWNRVYRQARERFHTTQIPVNTFNKVWIVPDKAEIYEKGNTAYIVANHLKVMLEEDYVALNKFNKSATLLKTSTESQQNLHPEKLTEFSKIVREIILPALEKEVNEGKHFSLLRQVYSGMLLATWYKRTLKESLLTKVYADKEKLKGIDQDPIHNQEIYVRYLQAFKKGVFNYIKEETDDMSGRPISRKYFSGGTTGYFDKAIIIDHDISKEQRVGLINRLNAVDQASITLQEPGLGRRSVLFMTAAALFASPAAATRQHSMFFANISRETQDAAMSLIPQGVIRWRDRFIEAIIEAIYGPKRQKQEPKQRGSAYAQRLRERAKAARQLGSVARKERVKSGKGRDSLSSRILVRDFIAAAAVPAATPTGTEVIIDEVQPKPVQSEVALIKQQPALLLLLMTSSNRDLEQEIIPYNTPEQFIDAYAEALGISPRELRRRLNDMVNADEFGHFETFEDYFKARKMGILSAEQMAGAGNEIEPVPAAAGSEVPIAFELSNFHGLVDENAFEREKSKVLARLREMYSPANREAVRDSNAYRYLSKMGIYRFKLNVPGAAYSILVRDFPEQNKVVIIGFSHQTGLKKNRKRGTEYEDDVEQKLLDYSARGSENKSYEQFVAQFAVQPIDAAMETTDAYGGIDFNAANMAMTIKRDGRGVPLPLSQQDMAQLGRIEGFIPEIIRIQPAVNLPIAQELQQQP